MTEFYFKEKGLKWTAEKYFKDNLKELELVLNITKKYLKEELNSDFQPTEIIFVKYPYLGDELFNDERIVTDKLDEPKEFYNNLGGVAIYIRSEQDQNQILRNGFRNLRISYISIIEHYGIVENALNALHEINHFRDPFCSSIDYATAIYEEGYKQDSKLFIEHKARHLLNEYYANLRSYTYLKSIMIFLKINDFDLDLIFNATIYNLTQNLNELRNQFNELKALEENYQRFDLYLSVCFKFLEAIYKLFGKWNGIRHNFKDIEKVFVKIWEFLIKKIQEDSLNFIIYYLNSIKSIINSDFEKIGDLKEHYNLFYCLAGEYPKILDLIES